MLGVSGRGRIVEQPAFRNEIRIERHVFVVFHLVRAAASTTNQLKYRLRSYYTEIIGLGESSRSSCSTRASRSCYMTFLNFPRAQLFPCSTPAGTLTSTCRSCVNHTNPTCRKCRSCVNHTNPTHRKCRSCVNYTNPALILYRKFSSCVYYTSPTLILYGNFAPVCTTPIQHCYRIGNLCF